MTPDYSPRSGKTMVLHQPSQDDAPFGVTIPGYVIWNVVLAQPSVTPLPGNLSRTWEFLVGAPANLRFFLLFSLSLLFLSDRYRVRIRAEGRYVPRCRNYSENRTSLERTSDFSLENGNEISGRARVDPSANCDRNHRARRGRREIGRVEEIGRICEVVNYRRSFLAFPFPMSLLLREGGTFPPPSNLTIGKPLDKP